MSHTSISITFSRLVLGSRWIVTLELVLHDWLIMTTWSLALSLIMHVWLLKNLIGYINYIILIVKCKHLGGFIILVVNIMLLIHLVLHVYIWSFIWVLLYMICIIIVLMLFVLLLTVTSVVIVALILEWWSFDVIVIVVCVSKSFCCCVLHMILLMRTYSLRSLWSVSGVSQWLSFFNTLVNIGQGRFLNLIEVLLLIKWWWLECLSFLFFNCAICYNNCRFVIFISNWVELFVTLLIKWM